ncbi:uncharacterized protein [Arachis hypogaea]|uniref:uncharacterized protein n=1 Tax=Arachis hypogaea TaxID=3818 RepID=UPI000DECC804|nr:uncharacterized protein LOC112756099 [Arachis hypogaea]
MGNETSPFQLLHPRCPDPNSTPERLCFSHTQSPSSALSPSSWPFPYLRPATASCRRRRSFQQPPSARSPSLHHAAAIDINLPFHRAEIATFLRRAATPPAALSLFSATTVPVRSPFEGTPPLSWSLGVSISHRAAIATFLRRATTPPLALSLFSAIIVPVRSPFEGLGKVGREMPVHCPEQARNVTIHIFHNNLITGENSYSKLSLVDLKSCLI